MRSNTVFFQEMGKKTGKRLVAWRSRNDSERRLVRRRDRERKKGLVTPRKQKKLAMEKDPFDDFLDLAEEGAKHEER